MRSIYGEQHGATRHMGLVDCDSNEQYEKYLERYKHMWDTLETEETGKSAIFSTWFSARKSKSVKTTMLQELRREAGQGDIPGQYTTNDAESLNSMISKWTGKNKQTWESISKSMKEFVESKHKELKMAVHCSGDRVMTEPYIHLKVTQAQWRNMTSSQREKHMKMIDNASGLDGVALSISPEESGNWRIHCQ